MFWRHWTFCGQSAIGGIGPEGTWDAKAENQTAEQKEKGWAKTNNLLWKIMNYGGWTDQMTNDLTNDLPPTFVAHPL